MNFTDLEDFEVFDIEDGFIVAAYTVMCAIGIVLNSLALITAGKRSFRRDMRRTNVHYLVFHLTLADSITCFVTMPMETLWKLTLEWHAGNLLCKVLMMVRTGGYILSSVMLVVLSIDRYISISRPLYSLNQERQRTRARLMVVLAWLLTILFSIPQAIIFSVKKHPVKDFYQCTTVNFFEDLSSPTMVDNTTQLILGGLTPKQWGDLYHTIFNAVIFFIPFVIIVASYVQIYAILTRRNKSLVNRYRNPASLRLRREAFSNSHDPERTAQRKDGTMKALKMSIIHVLTFVLSWTPYTLMATWDTIDKESADEVPGIVQDILYLTAILNSCINPLIYGVYYYRDKDNRARNGNIRLVSFHQTSQVSLGSNQSKGTSMERKKDGSVQEAIMMLRSHRQEISQC